MRITLIAAIADNRAIGKDNALAWNMPADRAFFIDQIRGHDVIMGRRTYESHQAEEPLPYRLPIVVTRQEDYQVEEGAACHSLEDAYALARKRGETEVFVLGGGEIYSLALPQADRLVITEIHTTIDGDAFFPEIDPAQWQEVSRAPHSADENNPFAYEFVVYRAKSR